MSPPRVEWSNLCEVDVLRIHWLTAHAICTAIVKFATTGIGRVETDPGSRRGFRLRVPGAVALAHFDVETGTIFVDRIYPTR
jgi:hypothetical protein